MRQPQRSVEGLIDRCGPAGSVVAQVALVDRQRARRNRVQDIEIAGQQVGIGGVQIGVELESQTFVTGLAVAVVVGVGHQVDSDVVFPGRPGWAVGEFVRAVADRVAAERGHVPKCGVRQRIKRAVAKAQREVDGRRLKPHGELQVVDHAQPGHGGPALIPWRAGHVIEPFDRAEKSAAAVGHWCSGLRSSTRRRTSGPSPASRR